MGHGVDAYWYVYIYILHYITVQERESQRGGGICFHTSLVQQTVAQWQGLSWSLKTFHGEAWDQSKLEERPVVVSSSCKEKQLGLPTPHKHQPLGAGSCPVPQTTLEASVQCKWSPFPKKREREREAKRKVSAPSFVPSPYFLLDCSATKKPRPTLSTMVQ